MTNENPENNDPPYTLEEVIEKLEKFKKGGPKNINEWEMALCFAKEIDALKEWKYFKENY